MVYISCVTSQAYFICAWLLLCSFLWLCDLESEWEAYTSLNTSLYKTEGVGGQGGRGENYSLLFPLV